MNLTLSELKEHLRYDNDDTSNDITLNSYLLAAKAAIQKYINKGVDIDTHDDLQIAVILLASYFDYYRNAEVVLTSNPNLLPSSFPVGILYLISPYKTPTVI